MMFEYGHITIKRATLDGLQNVFKLNMEIFAEDRLINSMDHDVLVILLADINSISVGFKIGYGLRSGVFYSAKGGVLPIFRRRGIGKMMLRCMEDIARSEGFTEMQYHTFPTKWPGMLSLGRSEGYEIREATWNPVYSDYQILLFKKLARTTDSS